MNFELIKKLRIEHGFTQEELGKKIGVSKQAIQKYETGNSKIGSDKVELLAEIFNVEPAVLMGWKTESEIENIELLEELHKNPDLKVLLYEGSKASPESLKAIIQLIKSNK